jgi:transcription elongation factor GreA
LSENAEYHAARERQSFIEGRIKELEDVTSRGEVIDASRITGKTVTFGVTVVIVDELTDVEYSYSIVGPYEAELEKRKISTASPIAKGLIGKQVGDSVEVQTPRGPHPYEILSISVYIGD